ncbi:MAG: hypothetical protein FWD59_03705 [Micrococcales bacterium]|nr:hypothetical protein [Micrococcales bacterium]
MLEIPEAVTVARQAHEAWAGRTITSAEAGRSPHGFAFYTGDAPEWYAGALAGQRLESVRPHAGYVVFTFEDWRLALSDGARLRRLDRGTPRPPKHQLLIEFDDGTALVCTVQMYACLALLGEGEGEDNIYFQGALRSISPLTSAFTLDHLRGLAEAAKPSLSAKGLLATEQRIPGLGNGCLHDILFAAGIHPQRRIDTLGDDDLETLHSAIVRTLTEMTEAGGRDTERDLHDKPGGYRTVLSAKTRDLPCPRCAGSITRKPYLGGHIYFCPTCQPLSQRRTHESSAPFVQRSTELDLQIDVSNIAEVLELLDGATHS